MRNAEQRERDAEPFVDTGRLRLLQTEILESGFERDALLEEMRVVPTCGLNVALAWPLPHFLKPAYEDLALRICQLGAAAYVYPFAQTHITLVTAVSFRQNLNPGPEAIARVAEASKELGNFVAAATRGMRPFTISVGPPVLARRAAFLPMLNPTLEVASLRRGILAFCQDFGVPLDQARAPQGLHATILRFFRDPQDRAGYLAAFHDIARSVPPSQVTIEQILITLETRPYMWRGEIARMIGLDAGVSGTG